MDQTTEESSFLKLLWYMVTLKTFGHLKGIYTCTNWIFLQILIILINFGLFFLAEQIFPGKLNIKAVIIVCFSVQNIVLGLVAFGFSMAYKNVGFSKFFFAITYSLFLVNTMCNVLFIYAELNGINSETIQYSLENNIPLSVSENVYLLCGILTSILSFYSMFFYVKRNITPLLQS